ncbi:hypothetical protein [Lacticaseibacillus paracasei]|uniref:hypothetical protein n=1 Tax=Lacticaseibacillus paracasei TaxID=1597 RepID=UPI00019CA1CA|nr:hypothetical protein [Lacticaseibacillus paracasei]EEI68247.1 hypothetical protein HMPREF0530_1455 [Lacticaseibacillus paracasei subsp. paracasei ATCC 25302 = DSM 5622 = JCM 8130]KRM64120.1 hypothetical protein FC74_GL002057 [Lacticaseibacillus paracasei subsp. paracasei ATCC 25302 = DSM 5622 = JCM 8130]MBA4475292.1 hypothetical protein [Lacticaseibacillus paracasei]TDG90647.1 hypothetical protein C5L26_001607 [Lacticaseibacillus paracasei subsp. paracasei]BAN72178.1 conserved hypothetical 
MSDKGLKTREGIKKRLLELSAEANAIKDHELGAAILGAYNVNKGLDKRIVGVELPKGPRAALIEFKEDGPYLNGARIDGITGMNIESKVGDFTKVDIKLVAKVHGLDDIKQEYSF